MTDHYFDQRYADSARWINELASEKLNLREEMIKRVQATPIFPKPKHRDDKMTHHVTFENPRLTHALRQEITDAVMEEWDALNPEVDGDDAQAAALEEVYEANVLPIVSALQKLPKYLEERTIIKRSTFSFHTPEGTFSFESNEERPFPSHWLDDLYEYAKTSGPKLKEYAALRVQASERFDRRQEALVAIQKTLEGCETVRDFTCRWPQGQRFVPDYVKTLQEALSGGK